MDEDPDSWPGSDILEQVPRSPQPALDNQSASNISVGPNVSMIERLSSSVRRLESELATAKEELLELGRLRNQTKEDYVGMLAELDEKRELAQKLDNLQQDHTTLSHRYDGALELLGEKSELVDELQLDIADLKVALRQAMQDLTKT